MDSSRDDDTLVAELRAALATLDPVPGHLVAAAKQSFAWRRVDEELAELISDSATHPLTAARSGGHPGESRLLTFEGPGLTVEVEITPQGDRCRLVGQLVPPRHAHMEVRWQGGSVTCEADAIGLFSADSVPPGPVSIACRLQEGHKQVVTSWVTI